MRRCFATIVVVIAMLCTVTNVASHGTHGGMTANPPGPGAVVR